ncbi:MAG: hypothetical protein RLN62_02970 [Rickettsiales bacterium]
MSGGGGKGPLDPFLVSGERGGMAGTRSFLSGSPSLSSDSNSPGGSVVVKEETNPDGKFVVSFTEYTEEGGEGEALRISRAARSEVEPDDEDEFGPASPASPVTPLPPAVPAESPRDPMDEVEGEDPGEEADIEDEDGFHTPTEAPPEPELHEAHAARDSEILKEMRDFKLAEEAESTEKVSEGGLDGFAEILDEVTRDHALRRRAGDPPPPRACREGVVPKTKEEEDGSSGYGGEGDGEPPVLSASGRGRSRSGAFDETNPPPEFPTIGVAPGASENPYVDFDFVKPETTPPLPGGLSPSPPLLSSSELKGSPLANYMDPPDGVAPSPPDSPFPPPPVGDPAPGGHVVIDHPALLVRAVPYAGQRGISPSPGGILGDPPSPDSPVVPPGMTKPETPTPSPPSPDGEEDAEGKMSGEGGKHDDSDF